MRVRFRFLWCVAAVVACAAWVPTALAVTPGAQVDQSQSVVEGTATITPSFMVGQVFTAGISGGLTDIVITLANPSGATGNLSAVLTRIDGSGAPDLSSPLASIALSPGQFQATATPTELHFPGAPQVTSGNGYAIVLRTTDSTGYEISGAGSIDFYLRGQAYFSSDGGASWSNIGGDANFSTYVLPWRADAARIAYCLAGRFLDLAAGQPDNDPAYAGAAPAIFLEGMGLTCSRPPTGYVPAGKTTEEDHVGAGIYDRYAPATA